MALRVVFAAEHAADFANVLDEIRGHGYEVQLIHPFRYQPTASRSSDQDAVVIFVPLDRGGMSGPGECQSTNDNVARSNTTFLIGMAPEISSDGSQIHQRRAFDEVIPYPPTVDDLLRVLSGCEARLVAGTPGSGAPPEDESEHGRLKEFYERIVDTISDGIRVIDGRNRTIVLANRAHLSWIGKQAHEVIGARARDVPWGFDADDCPVQMTDIVDVAIETAEPARRLIATRPRVGRELRWIDVVAYPMSGASGSVDHVVLVGRDVSERVRMETSLAAERDRRDHVLRSAPVGILTTDSTGTIEFANPPIAQIMGLEGTDTVAGKNILVVPQLQAMEIAAGLWEVLTEGKPLHLDRVSCRGTGRRETIFNVRAEPIISHAGEISGIVAVFEDVTETVLLQRRLSATTADLAMLSEIGELFQDSRDTEVILQTILVGVTAGEGLGFNRAFLLVADHETGTLRGSYAIGPSDLSEASRIWQELGKKPHSFRDILEGYREAISRDEVTVNKVAKSLVISLEDAQNIASKAAKERRAFLVTDGMNHPLVPRQLAEQLGTDSFVVAPLIFEDRVEGVIIADNAITRKSITELDLRSLELFAHQARLAVERSRLHAELERQLEELREAHELLRTNHEEMLRTEKLAAMGQVAAQVAHEIRNPLVAIGGFARSIRNSLREDDQNRKFAEIIVEETARLENILREVLDFARPPKPRHDRVDVCSVLRRATEMLERELQKRSIRINMQIPRGPIMVLGDAGQLRQVFHNLLQNAMDAMERVDKSSRLLSISLSCETDRQVTVTVEDTGGGFEADALEHVFEPFFTTKSHGTGLGLAICQQIVQDHGGTIYVTNRPERGATFAVRLPLLEKEVLNGENPGS